RRAPRGRRSRSRRTSTSPRSGARSAASWAAWASAASVTPPADLEGLGLLGELRQELGRLLLAEVRVEPLPEALDGVLGGLELAGHREALHGSHTTQIVLRRQEPKRNMFRGESVRRSRWRVPSTSGILQGCWARLGLAATLSAEPAGDSGTAYVERWEHALTGIESLGRRSATIAPRTLCRSCSSWPLSCCW